MSLNRVIYLITSIETKDDVGQIIDSEPVKKKVFAELVSVGRSEFYLSQTAGYTPTAIFRMRKKEYCNQTYIEFESKPYRVIRAYVTNLKNQKTTSHALFDERYIELTCEDWVQ